MRRGFMWRNLVEYCHCRLALDFLSWQTMKGDPMTPPTARPSATLPADPSGWQPTPARWGRRPPLGSFSWTLVTGGRLGWRDRLALVMQGMRARTAARRHADGPRPRMLDIDQLLPPDTPVARE